jgi:hypothetical protein
MKKLISRLTIIIALQFCAVNLFSQSVAINTDGTTAHSSALLDIKSTTKGLLAPRMTTVQRTAIATPAAGLLVYDTDTNSFWFYNGLAWTNLSAGGFVNYWSPNASDIFSNVTGNVGIGTATPTFKLSVSTPNNSYGIIHTNGTVVVGTYIGNSEGWLGTKSNHPLSFFTNNSNEQMTLLTNGNVGIGTTNPVNKLQIGSMGGTGFNGNDFAFGNGTHATGFFQSGSFLQIASSTNIALMPVNGNGIGKIGIGITDPGNKLQIGSMGAAGFNGNDFAIGNGTNALAIYQSNTATQVASSTDLILLPRINGGGVGRVGINTSTPRAPLDVADNLSVSPVSGAYDWAYFTLGYNNFQPVDLEGATDSYTSVPNVSIFASNRILASEFDAFSDARIKTITGVSNSSEDLKTLNSLSVTDYTMKDKVKYGNKPFKKVIAQQVEKVYPQVISKHTDFIPNVYRLTSKVEKVTNGYLLHFDKKHNITSTAQKLQVLVSGKDAMQQFDVVSIPNDNDVVIVEGAPAGEVTGLNIDKMFVYGEEVNDFRTVDYEGLTTLNISATQELSKLVKKQQTIIETQQQQIDALMKRIEALEKK